MRLSEKRSPLRRANGRAASAAAAARSSSPSTTARMASVTRTTADPKSSPEPVERRRAVGDRARSPRARSTGSPADARRVERGQQQQPGERRVQLVVAGQADRQRLALAVLGERQLVVELLAGAVRDDGRAGRLGQQPARRQHPRPQRRRRVDPGGEAGLDPVPRLLAPAPEPPRQDQRARRAAARRPGRARRRSRARRGCCRARRRGGPSHAQLVAAARLRGRPARRARCTTRR